MIASDDLVRHPKGPEEVCGELVALGGPCEEFVRLVGPHRLALPQVPQAHDRAPDPALGCVLDDGLEVAPPRVVVLHLPWVEVQVWVKGNGDS
jgi:hypothetical protein